MTLRFTPKRAGVPLEDRSPKHEARSPASPVPRSLYGDRYAPLRQVRRALRTWADVSVTHTKAKSSAEQMLVQLDHPDATDKDRTDLVRLLTQAGKTGHFDGAKLEHTARRVCDPHGTGLARGPFGMLDVDAFLWVLERRVTGLANLDAGEEAYEQARRLYRASGPTEARHRDPSAAHAALVNPRSAITAFAGFEGTVKDACIDLITLLGTTLLTPPAASIKTPVKGAGTRKHR